MKYETLYTDFISLFPDDKQAIKQLETENAVIPTEDGMHILFGLVVVPFVVNLINTCDEKKVRIAFNFFENMAKSKSKDIGEVLDFTVLEEFISRGNNILEKSKSYMGQQTLDNCKNVEKWFIT